MFARIRHRFMMWKSPSYRWNYWGKIALEAMANEIEKSMGGKKS